MLRPLFEFIVSHYWAFLLLSIAVGLIASFITIWDKEYQSKTKVKQTGVLTLAVVVSLHVFYGVDLLL